jgi:hypothetical protein
MNTLCDSPCRFREEQRLNQWWLYVIVGTVAVITTTLLTSCIHEPHCH